MAVLSERESQLAKNLPIPHDEIAAFCQKYHIRRLAIFGSALRPDFRPDSDVDVMVAFDIQDEPSLMELLNMEAELSSIFGRKVDLGEQQSIEEDPNYIRRQHILNAVNVIYER